MSWLLAATTPLLLMLAAVGLERIETGLQRSEAATLLLAQVPANPDGTAPGANPQFHPTRRPNPV